LASFVIGDTHGCLKTLRHLLEEKLALTHNDSVYFLGDLIDRGQNSAQVITYILDLKQKGYNISSIRGNHEQMLLDAVDSKSGLKDWVLNTGNLTLNSYKKLFGHFFTFPEGIPNEHLNFFKNLPIYQIVGNSILVHGGLNYNANNPFEDHTTMLWSRPGAVPSYFMPDKIILHGHTPTPLDTIKQIVSNEKSRLIPLDGGCVYAGKYAGMGYLIALEIETMNLFWVEKMEN
jgi:serine/threonine protein phosphatase 1